MLTERISPRFVDLDAWDTGEALEAMLEGQMSAVAAVRASLPAISTAVEMAAAALHDKGRLIYLGAGTSGRVAAQDGAELPPTFDWPVERLMFAMAGGPGAFVKSVEGAEDDEADALVILDEARLTANDVVIGVAASGTTPFTVAGVRHGTHKGALTVGIANNPDTPLLAVCKCPILVDTGSELIAGSTRMKAGTAQKVVLNLFSTGIMVRLGRIYRGMMVNMHVSNAKLRRRAETIVARIAGCDLKSAREALAEAGGEMKLAVLLVLGLGLEEARRKLVKHGHSLRLALADIG